MQILRDRDVTPSPGLTFHRETSWSALVTGIVLLAAVIAVAAFLTVTGAWVSTWAIAGFAVWSAIMALPIWLYLRTFRASRRPEGWRLAWASDRLYLRFRSFQNHRFDPETPSVVAVAGREIAWIRGHTQTLEAQDDEGYWNTRYRIRGLQIRLKENVDTVALADALKEEAARRDAKGSRFNHYPVTLGADGLLRVEIRRPDPLLKQLRLYFAVMMPDDAPLTRFRDMTRDEQESHILDLAHAGQTIAAIKAAREVYGYGLAEAKQFVEGLTRG